MNAKASREHAELLQHFSRGDERKNFMDDGGVGIQQQALLREQAGISRSTTQVMCTSFQNIWPCFLQSSISMVLRVCNLN